MQFLYQNDFVKVADVDDDLDLSETFHLFCTLYQVNKKARPYALDLIRGVLSRIEKIDDLISSAGSHWRLSRIAPTDRNLLRIAVFEMTLMEDVPHQVAINEAVEISKRFAGDESPRFINGVLDAVRSNLSQ